MADEKTPDQPKPAAPQPPKAPEPRSAPSETSTGSQSGTFGDGSTQEQQDAQVKAAEEANEAVRRFADTERKARQG